MRTIEVKVYKFDELTEKAKEKARQWYREIDDFDPEMEPFETAAKLLGINFAQTSVPLMSGKTRSESDIRYSISYSQGDGASFAGSYEYAKGCSKAIRAEFPTDTKLHSIADGLTAIQKDNRYTLKATINHTGSYFAMGVETIRVTRRAGYTVGDTVSDDTNTEVYKLMRSFASWIYDGLRAECDYRASDENVDESITANEYEFTEDGDLT